MHATSIGYFFSALCTNASSPSNGEVTSAGNSVGDTATYTCNIGFELIGQAVATCTQASDRNSATIVPAPPVCQGIDFVNFRRIDYLCCVASCVL